MSTPATAESDLPAYLGNSYTPQIPSSPTGSGMPKWRGRARKIWGIYA
jgi:hypothetical protein